MSRFLAAAEGATIVALAVLVGCQPARQSSHNDTEPPTRQARPVAQSLDPSPSSPEAKLERIQVDLEQVKAELYEGGKYNCCIEPRCNWCALHEGECPCFASVQAGEAVCPGCGLGWHNGQGIVEGVDAKDVRWDITHAHPTGGHAH